MCLDFNNFWFIGEMGYVELNGNDEKQFWGAIFKMADIFPPKFPFAPISTIFGLQGKQGMPSWMAMTKNNFERPFSKWPTFSRQNFHLLRFQRFLVYRGNRVCRVEWQWRKIILSGHFQNGRHFPANFCICYDFNDFWFTWETGYAEFYGNVMHVNGV